MYGTPLLLWEFFMTTPDALHTSAQTIFYLPRWMRVTYALLVGCIAVSHTILLTIFINILFFGVMGSRSWDYWRILSLTFILGTTIVMFLIAFRLYGHTQTILIVSDEEVVFDTFWEKMVVPWEMIERIATISINGVASEAFLLTSSVPWVYRWGAFPFLRMRPVHIPLSGFGRSYGDDPLANAIQKHAPLRLRSMQES
jgi:hypothetical protein